MSTPSPLPDGAAPVPAPIAIPAAAASAPGVSRHGRAADALISSYLRELLADDEPTATAVRADDNASDEPATLI